MEDLKEEAWRAYARSLEPQEVETETNPETDPRPDETPRPTVKRVRKPGCGDLRYLMGIGKLIEQQVKLFHNEENNIDDPFHGGPPVVLYLPDNGRGTRPPPETDESDVKQDETEMKRSETGNSDQKSVMSVIRDSKLVTSDSKSVISGPKPVTGDSGSETRNPLSVTRDLAGESAYNVHPVTDHQSPVTNNEALATDHQSPITDHASLPTNHESPVTDHEAPQPPITNHESLLTDPQSPYPRVTTFRSRSYRPSGFLSNEYLINNFRELIRQGP